MSTPEQSPAPQPGGSVVTESPNSIDYYDDSIGDSTPRPARSPEVLRRRPPERLPGESPPEKTEERSEKPELDNGGAES
jgi:hypothetical protein